MSGLLLFESKKIIYDVLRFHVLIAEKIKLPVEKLILNMCW